MAEMTNILGIFMNEFNNAYKHDVFNPAVQLQWLLARQVLFDHAKLSLSKYGWMSTSVSGNRDFNVDKKYLRSMGFSNVEY